jgi:hypothetical protein
VGGRIRSATAGSKVKCHRGNTRARIPLDAVSRSCETPIWSQAGIVIETIREMHGGPFDGQHARYVLRSLISILEKKGCKS